MTITRETVEALRAVFESANDLDSNFEPANVVDGLFFIGRAIHAHGEAVSKLASAVERFPGPEQTIAALMAIVEAIEKEHT